MKAALDKAASLGAKVTYAAPLLTIDDLTNNLGAPDIRPGK